MNQEERAVFESWLENYATEEERALPFDEQLKAHILWLIGEDQADLSFYAQDAYEGEWQ